MEQAFQGIDRAALHIYKAAEAPPKTPASNQGGQLEPHSANSDGQVTDLKAERSSSSASLPRLSKRTRLKVKVKKVLHIHTRPQDVGPVSSLPALAPPPVDADGSDNDRFSDTVPEPPSKLPSARALFQHPVETVQSAIRGSGAEEAAKSMQNTAISHGADVRLVRAHDKLATADDESGKKVASEELDRLKETRQDAFVRWTMDQYLREVTSVSTETMPWRSREEFLVTDEHGTKRMQWAGYGRYILLFWAQRYGGHYIGASSERPAANQEAIRVSLERLLVTSTPFQVFFVSIRDIYRWENQMKTARYLVAYFFLWAFDCISGFAICSVLWLVLRQRFHPPTMEEFRDDVKRSEDVDKKAQSVAQLIERHGPRGWIDALIDEVGPGLMLEVEDTANFLERLQNFYEWRDPARTATTLILLAVCLLVISIAPTWLLVKSTLFFAGAVFFGLFPISSRYPQYRLLASPTTWLFWKVPTHAEWAIARIQSEARHNKKITCQTEADSNHDQKTEVLQPPPVSSIATGIPRTTTSSMINHQLHENQELSAGDDKEDIPQTESEDNHQRQLEIGEYHCKTGKHFGKLCVSSSGVRFQTFITSKKDWEMHFDDLRSMKKSISSGDDALTFIQKDQREFSVSGLEKRDEIFTQIIGYSGLQWQSIW